ncbi:MAG: hypothetical protein EOP11_06905 [Proteobacteria bacterium]|nr:MAG: hypothetical protein EOP11_06905 [Pseudomonadota bacterium]
MKRALLAALAVFLFVLPHHRAHAAESENTVMTDTGPRFAWGSLFEKMHATYSGLLEGPRMDHLDGNLDGKGSFLQVKNYVNADYEVAPNWKAELNTEFRQYFRAEDPSRPGRPDFEMRDPSLGISRRNIVEAGAFTLSGRTRYGIPVSQNTRARVGKSFDTGKGSLYLQAVPAWRWRDGALSLTCPVEMYVNFAKAPTAAREQYSLKAKAQVAYQLAKSWAAKLEYSTGDVRHNARGQWSKLNDRELGHKVMAGAAFAPIKQIVLNPSLTWGREHWRLNQPEISLYASYNFL